MANCKKIIAILFVLITCKVPSFGQENILLNQLTSFIPDGRISQENQNKQLHVRSIANESKANDLTLFYKYTKAEYYNKEGEFGDWELNYITNYEYNDRGDLIKEWDEEKSWGSNNSYSLYFYDSLNRNNRIEHYWDNYDGGIGYGSIS